MPNGNATIESRRFGVEIEVEGISTERARRELRPPAGSRRIQASLDFTYPRC